MLKLEHYVSRLEELCEAADREIALEIQADLLTRAYSVMDTPEDAKALETNHFRIRFLNSGYVVCEPLEGLLKARYGHEGYNSYLVYTDSSLRSNVFGTETFQRELREIFLADGFKLPRIEPAQATDIQIRPFLSSDSHKLFRFLEANKPSVAKVGFASIPFSPATTASWLSRDSLVQCIAHDESGEIVGLCGAMEKMHGVPGTQSSTLFYLVSPAAQGRGLAGRLSLAAMQLHQEMRPDVSHVVIHTEPDNMASKRVWQKLGLQRDTSTDYSAQMSGKQFNLLGASARIDQILRAHDLSGPGSSSIPNVCPQRFRKYTPPSP